MFKDGKSRLEMGLVHFFYDDQKYMTKQILTIKDKAEAARTSVRASDVELARHTVMSAITVTDWNLRVRTGHTATGEAIGYAIGKSLAGTGAVAQAGTISLGTAADDSNLDGTCTSTDFAAGDDIVFTLLAGTAGQAGATAVDADVLFNETFVA